MLAPDISTLVAFTAMYSLDAFFVRCTGMYLVRCPDTTELVRCTGAPACRKVVVLVHLGSGWPPGLRGESPGRFGAPLRVASRDLATACPPPARSRANGASRSRPRPGFSQPCVR